MRDKKLVTSNQKDIINDNTLFMSTGIRKRKEEDQRRNITKILANDNLMIILDDIDLKSLLVAYKH